MTHDEFTLLLKQPRLVESKHIPELKEMISYYPYFAEIKVLLARAMLVSGNVNADHYVNNAALCVPDRRILYFYLFPERKTSSNSIPVNRIPKYEGTYFDLIKAMDEEGADTKESFKNLAQKLKAARAMMTNDAGAQKLVNEKPKVVRASTPEYFGLENENNLTEDYAKKLIKEKKYEAAIIILKKLNLINPKKSIYFADQIRFLEKILLNKKK